MRPQATGFRKLKRFIRHGLFTGMLLIQAVPVWAFSIASPNEGQVFHPGDTVSVVAEALPGESIHTVYFESNISGILSEGPGYFNKVNGPPFQTSFTVPVKFDFTDRITISAIGVRGESPNEEEIKATPITIRIALPSNVRLERLQVHSSQEMLFMRPQSADGLHIYGHYSDGVEREVGASFTGTTYTTSDPRVATVNPDGLVTAVAPGKAVITVKNADKQLQVKVTVEAQKPPGSFLPTIPGLKLNSMTVTPLSLSPSVQTEAARTKQLNVEGLFSDGEPGDITSSAWGTSYQSSNTQVATVDKNGLVTARGIGQAVITVKNEDKAVQVPVRVE